jgi:hypothetical protein
MGLCVLGVAPVDDWALSVPWLMLSASSAIRVERSDERKLNRHFSHDHEASVLRGACC